MTTPSTGDARAEESGPITRDEMIAMFGAAAPIEAVNLLWNSNPSKTLGDIRKELRAMAKTSAVRDRAEERVVEAVAAAILSEQLGNRSAFPSNLDLARAAIEAYRKAMSE